LKTKQENASDSASLLLKSKLTVLSARSLEAIKFLSVACFFWRFLLEKMSVIGPQVLPTATGSTPSEQGKELKKHIQTLHLATVPCRI